MQDLHTVDTGNHYRNWLVHGEVQALDGCNSLALQNDAVAHALHSKNADILFHKLRKHIVDKAAEVRIHHIHWHLNRIEPEIMRGRQVEHVQMDSRILVAGESDVAGLSRFLRSEKGLGRAARGEETVNIVESDDLMALDEIHVIDLQPAQRFIHLARCRFLGASIYLGHQKRPLPVAVPQRFPHADLALPLVVIPRIVHEREAAVDRCPHDANALVLILYFPDMRAA